MKLALFGMPEAEAAWQSKHSKLCSFYKRYGHTKYLYMNTKIQIVVSGAFSEGANLIPSATHHVVQKSMESQQVPVV